MKLYTKNRNLMAQLISESKFDYVFLKTNYTDVLMGNNFTKYFSVRNEKFNEYMEHILVHDFDICNVKVMSVCNSGWDDSEIYADSETINFLKQSDIDPSGCVIIGTDNTKMIDNYKMKYGDKNISFIAISEVVNTLVELGYCGHFDTRYPSNVQIYNYQEKKIAKFIYDTSKIYFE